MLRFLKIMYSFRLIVRPSAFLPLGYTIVGPKGHVHVQEVIVHARAVNRTAGIRAVTILSRPVADRVAAAVLVEVHFVMDVVVAEQGLR